MAWLNSRALSSKVLPPRPTCRPKPVARHPVKVATIEGLYMAGSTSEGLSAYQDLDCEAAMKAVDLVESEMSQKR